MATVFCDSFANYDTAGIALKYSTAGGAIETNLAHVRTGPQSLRIQSGDAPSIINLRLPADVTQTYAFAPQYYMLAVGMAYQAGALNGNVFELWRNLNIFPAPPERLLYVRLNVDGSVSVLTDPGAVELGRSAAGVITIGAFYYFTLSADLLGISGPTFVKLNITTSGMVSTDVVSVSPVVLADTFVDSVVFGGPAGPDHGWVNDFYFQNTHDGSLVPLAPNIYCVLPNADGTPITTYPVVPGVSSEAPWQPTGSTHFNLVNVVPENTAQGMQWNTGYESPPGTTVFGVYETLRYDASALPNGRVVQGIQVVYLWEYANVLPPSPTNPAVEFQDNAGNLIGPTSVTGVSIISGLSLMPFMYVVSPQNVDPFTGLAWLISDWKNGLREIGPGTISVV
jgi:hypothetical protein